MLQQVGIEGLTYAGNHGLEILHPDGSRFIHPMPVEFEGKVSELLKALQDQVPRKKRCAGVTRRYSEEGNTNLTLFFPQVCKDGAWVENKGALLTFHYRETPTEARPELVAKAQQLIQEHGFAAGQAHCAIEAKPPVQWNKGRASIYILRTAFGLDWSERVRIIYAGDDVTDEDAMQVYISPSLPSSPPN